jgi:osmotically-inducible protein OsmY
MKTDAQIKQDILDELVFQPNIDETQIGVVVDKGVVMLTGVVDDFYKKIAAEKAVKKVKGVKAVAEDIQVKYGSNYQKTDKEIAKAIIAAFEWNTAVPEDDITIEIRNGWVDLSGEVEFLYQKEATERVAQNILGVKGINNTTEIKTNAEPLEIKEELVKAFNRSALMHAQGISVEVHNDTIKLTGKVHSLIEKEEAQKVALHTPGISKVENKLEIKY